MPQRVLRCGLRLIFLLGVPAFAIGEVEIQARLVEDCTTILDRMLGRGKAKIVIRVEGERSELRTQTELLTPMTSSGPVSLPGFTVSRTLEKTFELLQKDQDQATRTSSFAIRRLEAFVVYEDSLPRAQVDQARTVLSDLLRINPERGDALTLVPVAMVPPWRTALASEEGVRLLAVLAAAAAALLGAILASHFLLMRPGRRLLEQWVERLAAAQGAAPAAAELIAPGMPRLGLEPSALGAASPPLLAQRFSFLESRAPSELADVLKDEGPEDLALLFAYLAAANPTHSSLAFATLPHELKLDVSQRMLALKFADPERLALLEERVRSRVELMVQGPDRLGSIYSHLPPEQRSALLADIAARDPEAPSKLSRAMVPFESLLELAPEDLRVLLPSAPREDWAAALKGLPAARVDDLLGELPEKTRLLVQDAMAAPLPTARVLAARARILAQAQALARQGRLSLGARPPEAELL
ncbi:MAG: hypothetical protein HY554_15545 [Elusimicrobia bacterium]|nr:hypothetical protein [Elusimicrobiota bacterium]